MKIDELANSINGKTVGYDDFYLNQDFTGRFTLLNDATNGDIVTLTLTSVDYELFFMQYEVSDITYHDGFKFKRLKGIFTFLMSLEKLKKSKTPSSAMPTSSQAPTFYYPATKNSSIQTQIATLMADISAKTLSLH